MPDRHVDSNHVGAHENTSYKANPSATLPLCYPARKNKGSRISKPDVRRLPRAMPQLAMIVAPASSRISSSISHPSMQA